MTPEIIARVDAWLLDASDEYTALAVAWSWLSTSLDKLPDPLRRGVEAAMGGVLPALVREAWDDPGAHSYRLVDGRWATLVAVKDRSEANGRLVNTADGPRWLAMYIGETEADSRVSALEAAPKAVRS